MPIQRILNQKYDSVARSKNAYKYACNIRIFNVVLLKVQICIEFDNVYMYVYILIWLF